MIILPQVEADDIRTIATLSNSPISTNSYIKVSLDLDEFDISFRDMTKQYIIEIDTKKIIDSAEFLEGDDVIFGLLDIKSAFSDVINNYNNISIDLMVDDGINFSNAYVRGDNISNTKLVDTLRITFNHTGLGWAAVNMPAKIYRIQVRFRADLILYDDKYITNSRVKFAGIVVYISSE